MPLIAIPPRTFDLLERIFVGIRQF